MEKISRNESRMLAMTILYQINLFKKKKIDYQKEEVINNNLDELSEIDTSFVKVLVEGVLTHEKELINISNKYLKNWSIDRLGLTDAAILKIALYELLYTNTPKKVCIDEAIELAKDFSDEKVVGMINSVLDKVYHQEILKEGLK